LRKGNTRKKVKIDDEAKLQRESKDKSGNKVKENHEVEIDWVGRSSSLFIFSIFIGT